MACDARRWRVDPAAGRRIVLAVVGLGGLSAAWVVIAGVAAFLFVGTGLSGGPGSSRSSKDLDDRRAEYRPVDRQDDRDEGADASEGEARRAALWAREKARYDEKNAP